jgi:hypothetical protein
MCIWIISRRVSNEKEKSNARERGFEKLLLLRVDAL